MKEINYKDFIYSIELAQLSLELMRMRQNKDLSQAQTEKIDWMSKKVEIALWRAEKCELAILQQSDHIRQLISERDMMKEQLYKWIAESDESEKLKKLADEYFEKK